MLIPAIDVAINGLSAFSGLLMMGMVGYFQRLLPEVINSISFRISFWIGLVDMLWRIEYILVHSDEVMDPFSGKQHWFVRMLGFSGQFLKVWSALLSFCIALDLQLSFIHRRTKLEKIQRCYVPVAFMIAFLANIEWLVYPDVSYRKEWETIVPGWSRRDGILNMALGVSVWVAAAILYSMFVVVLVLVRVLSETRRLQTARDVTEALRIKERALINSVLRIVLYPLVLIVTQPTGLVADWLYTVTSESRSPILRELVKVDAVLVGLIGVLNLIVFLLNPALHRALAHVPWWPLFSKSRHHRRLHTTRLESGDTQTASDFRFWKRPGEEFSKTLEEVPLSLCQENHSMASGSRPESLGGCELGRGSRQQPQLLQAYSLGVEANLREHSPNTPSDWQLDNVKFKWVLGRRFCDEQGARYLLPNDDAESDRLIMRHYAFRSLFAGADFLSPIRQRLERGCIVLDVGCGPGTWTLEMATTFPNSHFVGIDMSSIFPHQITPKNCQFQLANFLKGLPFENDTFDFIYLRCVQFGLVSTEWPGLIQEILRVLKPEGYLEIVEADYAIQGGGPAFRKIADGLYNSMRARCNDPSWVHKIGNHFNEIGLEDVQVTSVPFPMGKYAGRIGKLGQDNWIQLVRSLRPFLTQVMVLDPEDYDQLETRIAHELETHRVYIDIVATYAKKPPHHPFGQWQPKQSSPFLREHHPQQEEEKYEEEDGKSVDSLVGEKEGSDATAISISDEWPFEPPPRERPDLVNRIKELRKLVDQEDT
ncbi:uncharacterized protein VTP21DRAFT_3239 [Calcarisporiella thermophila]|uniref:uncharacterized protein n=1 Tax=Calcarisporiella thermophila TaxID=911321 RepID=UPI003742C526